jgi:two-component system response regulator WspF
MSPASAVQLLSKVDVITSSNGRDISDKFVPLPSAPLNSKHHVVAIGASAGGPAALAAVLKDLPPDFPAGIVIVQHLSAEFVPGLVEWLRTQTQLKVNVAEEGSRPTPGQVLVAGTNNHLIFSKGEALGYTAQPEDCIHRPSIDVLFKSVAQHWPHAATGVLLTGMGRDGAAGLKMIRNRGCLTLTQDQATSVVYGMPKAAAAIDAATEILPLDRIAPRLRKVFQPRN